MSGIIIEEIDQDTVHFSFTNGSLKVLIHNGDLSREPCDAVVNPTNESMVPDGGLDALIHQQMGQFFTDQVVAIHKEMNNQSCPVGQSRIFIAKFNCAEHEPRFVISTVGPVYQESEKERAAFLLQSCYYTSLALANIYQLASIAYPAISCGANHFPVHEAARVAIDSIRRFSFNVKEVRFVLYDRSTFDIFIREWTDYAQQVNKEANIGDHITDVISESPKTSASKPPVPPKPTTRFCVLCKQNMLPTGRTILCLACSQLARAQVFKMFLSNLRTASENSYNDLVKECQLLQTVLSLYPLTYTPVQVFDQVAHMRDQVAEHYIHQYCSTLFRNFIPISIAGDGNCFYNSFVQLGGVGSTTDGSPLTSIELRARNVVELVLNIDDYKSQYDRLLSILDNFEEYARKEMVHDTNYVGIWDLLSIPSVLNIHLIAAYPKVNGNEDLNVQLLNESMFPPLNEGNDSQNQAKKSEIPPTYKEVRLLFSHANRPFAGRLQAKQMWSPNHFVPLLNMR
ncbi:unnamed protein product [Rotaria socialis]|uniref:OTU domain-containing protein n=1 Tax=Rotaria socialis TaxID=392032 RepID=A0A818KSM8_9BILA|nr:unnamed protein product [Rotaria socialis]